jgi:UDP:flavonoid glycosyltransferase YjiC (YdhE family)
MNKDQKRPVHFWIFGPELGCLTRELPLMEALIERGHTIRCFVHPQHVAVLTQTYGEKAKVHGYASGIELKYTATFDLDVSRSVKSVLAFVLKGFWQHYALFRRYRFEKPLIISDFLPHIHLFAKIHRLSCVGIYNYALKVRHFGSSPFHKLVSHSSMALFRLSYRLTKRMIIEQIVPQSQAGLCTAVTPMARKISRSRQEIRQELGVGENASLIFLSVGGNSNPDFWLKRFANLAAEKRWDFLVIPRNIHELSTLSRTYPQFVYPETLPTDVHNVIAACDLVISKAGFGTVREALAAGIPFLPLHLPHHPEIGETEQVLLAQKLAAERILESDNPEQIRQKMEISLKNRPIEPLSCNGVDETLRLLEPWLKH